MTIDEIKRALVEIKEFCEKIDSCDRCPLYDIEASYCPMNHYNPCNWHIDDWKEDSDDTTTA